VRLLALFAVPVCLAADLTTVLKAVEDRYNRVQTLQVGFTEEYVAAGRGRRKESGTLYLRKPGRMRWEYSSPPGKLFVSDGKFFYLYTPSNNRLHKTKVKQSDDMRAPLAFLLGRLYFQQDFRRFESRPEGPDTWVAADPKSQDLPYTRVEFVVTPQSQIRRVLVHGQDKSVLDFTFDSERVNPALSATLFEFQAPAGAEIVEAVER